ncbi:MAG: hypothetical protein ABFC89_00655 [Methanospirillum sp.]
MQAANHQWRAVGLAVRERDAVRLEVLDGEGAGTYFIGAGDVADAFDYTTVPVYRMRTHAGEAVPVEAGHVHTSESGRMLVVQLDGPHAIVMVPMIALRSHYEAGAGRPTRIVITPDPVTGPTAMFNGGPVAVAA